VLRAAGATETTQENIRNWLELGEGGPEYQLLTEDEITAVKFFFYLSSSALPILLHFPFICFLIFFVCLLGLFFVSLIQMTFPPFN
jgi:hypothetical protein